MASDKRFLLLLLPPILFPNNANDVRGDCGGGAATTCDIARGDDSARGEARCRANARCLVDLGVVGIPTFTSSSVPPPADELPVVVVVDLGIDVGGATAAPADDFGVEGAYFSIKLRCDGVLGGGTLNEFRLFSIFDSVLSAAARVLLL